MTNHSPTLFFNDFRFLLLPKCKGSSRLNDRILALAPVEGRSHFNVLEPLFKALAEKGHQVDVISHFPLKQPFPNYNEIVKLPPLNLSSNHEYENFSTRKKNFKSLHIWKRKYCIDTLENPEITRIIDHPPTDPPYDLLLIQFVSGYQCLTAIGHKWNVPVVGVATTFLYPYNHRYIGNPLNLAMSSSNLRVDKEKMNFWDRLYNFIMTHYAIYEFYSEAYKQDAIMKKYLGTNTPHYSELERSVSLLLSNSHHSLHGVLPKVPALIQIGGIHIEDDNSTIDPKLAKIMDDSEHGFIYFSFGTITKIESLPPEALAQLFVAFRRISPIQIIMKSQNPKALPKNLPDNVHTFFWLPQRKILQHPKIRGFISHGGGLGTQESVYYGVPTICVPLFADQHINCDITSEKGFGQKFIMFNAPQEEYHRVIDELLHNPSYKHAAKRISKVYKDRLVSPKEEATYWIEYVIRHGKDALRSRSLNYKWWQIELFDVYAFIMICILAAMYTAYFAACRLIMFALSFIKSFTLRYIRLSKKLR
ncbi:UDP-glucosyltransferase 2-like [Phymastichus coffea]|uniref:UDP-glucosyltransferase 2-like n=1 Tax=Phymastichus coffea TaxID=108790 RepID=UPI00273A8FF1|nr:UDP-glucosyltransferase 2-like [Phymastichus coffea]